VSKTRKLLLTLCLMFWPSMAGAGDRVAMVVGNSAYQHTSRLGNPGNDAHDMSAMLHSLGFTVFGGVDLDRQSLIEQLTQFGRSLHNAEVALLFYAGHGIQVNGENYLVPTDAKIEFEEEISLFLVPLSEVQRQMERGSKVRVVILDACRDNPFAALSRNVDRSAISLGKGLGRVTTEKGTFIAFATEPNAVASDGAGRNSPFTAAMLDHMGTPDISISELMIRVRKDVVAATNGLQTPWDSSSLVENVFLGGRSVHDTSNPGVEPALAELGLRGTLVSGEEAAYHASVSLNTCGGYEAFIRKFPASLYADFARERTSRLCNGVDDLKSLPEDSQVAGLAELSEPTATVSRSLGVQPIDTSGRKISIRMIADDDRDIGWVYVNNCGRRNDLAQRIRSAINAHKFSNLRLVPAQTTSFDPSSQVECQAGTTIIAYRNERLGALEGLADRTLNEIAVLLQTASVNSAIQRETNIDAIDDRYRFDIWLGP
jgi:hypothetical protein